MRGREGVLGGKETSLAGYFLICSFFGIFDFIEHFIEVFKLFVDACKADIGDLIEFTEAIHDCVTNFFCGDFAFEFAEHFFFDGFCELAFFFCGYGSLGAGGFYALEDSLEVEGLARAIAFDDHHAGGGFDSFVGGEAFATSVADAAAADGAPAFAGAAVYDAVIAYMAVRANHEVLCAGLGWKATCCGQECGLVMMRFTGMRVAGLF